MEHAKLKCGIETSKRQNTTMFLVDYCSCFAAGSDGLAMHHPRKFKRKGQGPKPDVRRTLPGRLLVAGAFVSCIVCAAFLLNSNISKSRHSEKASPSSLAELLSLNPEQISSYDVARINLLCAEGLPGISSAQAKDFPGQLDSWAQRVKMETERHMYRFTHNPAMYEHSEGYFRMLMMAVVLTEDFSIRYNAALMSAPSISNLDYGFYQNPEDVFLHGLLGEGRTGTCSSMPVLYAAIARRLGYPIKLVTTKAHVFLRWEDQTELFNLEATGRGMNRYDDAHFKAWPFPVSDEEIRLDGYLRSLSASEELALFLSLRGHCLTQAGRQSEAREAYQAACRFAPASRPYRLLLSQTTAPHYLPDTSILPVFRALPAGGGPPDPNPLLQNRRD